jgi:hypothetical protein
MTSATTTAQLTSFSTRVSTTATSATLTAPAVLTVPAAATSSVSNEDDDDVGCDRDCNDDSMTTTTLCATLCIDADHGTMTAWGATTTTSGATTIDDDVGSATLGTLVFLVVDRDSEDGL